jgi:hypothetical protein
MITSIEGAASSSNFTVVIIRSSLKRELVHRHRLNSPAQCRRAIFARIKRYN